MKATGIVRRIDDLGRVVIPKEIRRTLRIREGDPLEIYTNVEGEVIFKKYSPIGEIAGFAGQYAEVLSKLAGLPAVICDQDHVIAVSGVPKKELLERRVTPALEELTQNRKSLSYTDAESPKIKPVEGVMRYAVVSFPIITEGDVSGSIMLISGNEDTFATDIQIKLVQAAAAFLGKQMEG
ncbi:MAG: AbrB/MazE/SpoVT family DNA-binding domain-containing protein [Ruminococcaceae bacterium]|nr:AbrB/MazE/SpoVT family DNA-binding domain-containing protein [Oscillospiraceae bacterium]